MNTFKSFCCLLVSLTSVLSCSSPIGGEDEPEVVKDILYKVNGVSHDIKVVALSHEDGRGYNLVFSDDYAPLTSRYCDISNREYNLFSIDFPDELLSVESKASEVPFDSDLWSFYIASWDATKFEYIFSETEKSGSFFVDVTSNKLTVDMSLVMDDGNKFEVYYDGPFVSEPDYVWSEFSTSGSVAVNKKLDCIYFDNTVSLFRDTDNSGINLKITAHDNVYILDFPSTFVENKSIVGADDFTIGKNGSRYDWTFAFSYLDSNEQVWITDAQGDLKEGYFDCHYLDVTNQTMAIDMSIKTTDGKTIDFHYAGQISIADKYQPLKPSSSKPAFSPNF